MAMSEYLNDSKYRWIKNFDPKDRILTGNSYKVVKRFFDLFMVLVSSPLWLLIMVFTALAIKITSPGGPVFFVQNRTGRGGRRFQMLKFRSMVPNAEKMKGNYAKLNEHGELSGPLKLKNDPRITKLGRILRKSSIDELPQVLNVIKGDMSLVGPRPTSWSPDSYKLWQTERLDVMPGITGLFQLYGRGGEEFDEWLKWDVRYVERRSFLFDVMILIKTIAVIWKQKGAR